jgi:hypothetical protein
MGATRRSRSRVRAHGLAAAIAASCVLVGSCGTSEPGHRELRYITRSYSFTITPAQLPPHARESIVYKVFIRDRESREPIQHGEGQIYSSNREGAKTWDGLEYGPEVGTYRGKLNFVTSGVWQVAIRFRRDSLHRLETTEWTQEVLNERPDSIP